jgi:hypothetical protein
LLFKLFLKDNPPEFHLYCPSCSEYLGVDDSDTDKICETCELSVNINSSKDGNFFVTFSVENCLKKLITKFWEVMYFNTTKKQSNLMEDVYDGRLYKKLLETEQSFVSLVFNTDGVKVFNKLKKVTISNFGDLQRNTKTI